MKTIVQETRHTYLTEDMRRVINYSVFTTFIYSMVFFVAKIFNLESVTELRFINYLLLFPIVYSALKKVYNQHGQKMEYFSGFLMAFLIGFFGQLLYSAVFSIYLHIDTQLMSYLTEQFPRRILYPQFSIAFILLTEGTSISVIVALATMQYFKSKRGRWASTK